MRRKPRIAITAPATGGHIALRLTRWGVHLGGGRSFVLRPGGDEALGHFDGFILSGGGDINPQRYGEAAVAPSLQYDLARDALEAEVAAYALVHARPLLGICRGMQMLNVISGGSLFQEAREVLEDFLPNRSLISKIIGRRNVALDPHSRLFHILGEYDHYRVNSIHHQAVNRVGAGLRVVAREKNGLIQAVESAAGNPHPFLIGVQWHPELMLHARSARRLFAAFIVAAKQAKH